MYCKQSLKKYLDDLAAKLPAPGGGSAAACTGALAAALVSMVANFTIGKKKYKKYESVANDVCTTSEKLRTQFMQLIDEDVRVYKKVEKHFYSKDAVQKNAALKEAASVPLVIAKRAVEGMRLAFFFMNKCNTYLLSDIAVAAELFEGAFESAVINVNINCAYCSDKGFVTDVRKVIRSHAQEIKRFKKEIRSYCKR